MSPADAGAAGTAGVAGSSDSRPRPAYGEYATPEEQRARIRQPDATEALSSGQALAAGADKIDTPPATASGAAASGGSIAGAGTGAGAPPATQRPVDRTITVALLVFGLFTVVTSIAGLIDFSGFADTWMQTAGIDAEFTNYEQGRLWGTIGAIVFSIGWLLTAYLSWRRLRRGRIAFWVPIVGAIVSYIALTACLMVPLLGDPAIADYVTRMGS